MELFKITLVLSALFLLSLFLGAITSTSSKNEEGFAKTLRRGFSNLILLVVLGFVILNMIDNPVPLQRVAQFFQELLAF
ncbi:MAG: hypothetical protein SFU99_01465 [Saprospiraceae bacterium]|nr:hypothetical protein [Saprospiraceae bacterium]